jgi:hypothetical protein
MACKAELGVIRAAPLRSVCRERKNHKGNDEKNCQIFFIVHKTPREFYNFKAVTVIAYLNAILQA